jgi:hypothetical protein
MKAAKLAFFTGVRVHLSPVTKYKVAVGLVAKKTITAVDQSSLLPDELTCA